MNGRFQMLTGMVKIIFFCFDAIHFMRLFWLISCLFLTKKSKSSGETLLDVKLCWR